MEIYEQVTDDIFEKIKFLNCKNEPVLNSAKNLLSRICNRKFYVYVGDVTGTAEIIEEVKELIIYMMQEFKSVAEEKLVFEPINIDYGKGTANPINYLYFYKKHDPKRGKRISPDEESNLKPLTFCDYRLKIYYKDKGFEKIPDLRRVIKQIKSKYLERRNNEKGEE